MVAAHVLYLVPYPFAALAEAARVLQPGGLLVVTTTGADDKLLVQEVLEEALTGLVPATEVHARDLHRRFDLTAAAVGLRDLGLDVTVREARSVIRLPRPQPLLEYVASLRPLFFSRLTADQWDAAMQRAELALDRRLDDTGQLTTGTHVGVATGRRCS